MRKRLSIVAIVTVILCIGSFGGAADAAGPKNGCPVTVVRAVGPGQQPNVQCFNSRSQAQAATPADTVVNAVLYSGPNETGSYAILENFECGSDVEGVGWTNLSPWGFEDMTSSLSQDCQAIGMYADENLGGSFSFLYQCYYTGQSYVPYVGDTYAHKQKSIRFIAYGDGC